MKELHLELVEHETRVGKRCGEIEPNVTEDCIFLDEGERVGFYLSKINGKLKQLVEVANNEFISDNVPKSEMRRADTVNKYFKLKNSREPTYYGENTQLADKMGVIQMSAILGSVPPKAHFRRPYPVISSVHQQPKAQTFVKAMVLLARESESLVKKYLPEIYKKQLEVVSEAVPPKWQFSPMFTSSISNYNISAPFHIDTGNLKDTVNCIFTRRFDAVGGCLHIPDYNITVEQADCSFLCYPAWRNVHGVTPIRAKSSKGYRNSLIFYPLKGFDGY
tara:strand:- start:631 stop:1461 length:831 start_codon:yes stop_codon:yes gene_type:complete